MSKYYYPFIQGLRSHSPEEREVLSRDAVEGGPEEKARLVESTLRLVIRRTRSLATAFHLRQHDFEDAVHAGVLGCYEALERFDPEKGKWWTYARWYVNKNVINFCKGKHLTCFDPDDIQEPLSEAEDVWEEMDRESVREELEELLSGLTDYEYEVLSTQVLGEEKMTLREAGERIGKSHERVRQKTNETLKKLKRKAQHLR